MKCWKRKIGRLSAVIVLVVGVVGIQALNFPQVGDYATASVGEALLKTLLSSRGKADATLKKRIDEQARLLKAEIRDENERTLLSQSNELLQKSVAEVFEQAQELSGRTVSSKLQQQQMKTDLRTFSKMLDRFPRKFRDLQKTARMAKDKEGLPWLLDETLALVDQMSDATEKFQKYEEAKWKKKKKSQKLPKENEAWYQEKIDDQMAAFEKLQEELRLKLAVADEARNKLYVEIDETMKLAEEFFKAEEAKKAEDLKKLSETKETPKEVAVEKQEETVAQKQTAPAVFKKQYSADFIYYYSSDDDETVLTIVLKIMDSKLAKTDLQNFVFPNAVLAEFGLNGQDADETDVFCETEDEDINLRCSSDEALDLNKTTTIELSFEGNLPASKTYQFQVVGKNNEVVDIVATLK